MLKRLITLVGLVVMLWFGVWNFPAWTGEMATGSQIFSANCASCHIGGNNVILKDKTLQQSALEKYLDRYNEEPLAAVIYQVSHGKNAMPAFGGRLTDEEIRDVVTYVLRQAEQNWKDS